MRRYLYILLYLFVCIVFVGQASIQQSFAQEQISIPGVTPYWIKRQAYDNSSALVLSKLKSAQASQDSLKGFLTVIPSVAGGSVIAFGSILAWLSAKKRKKAFKKYMEDIAIAEKIYSSSVLANPKGRIKRLAELKEVFSKLEEKADLSAANKEIDEEQRTTISNTIERKIDEIGKIG